MQAELIIWPMILLAIATIAVYVPMVKARFGSVKSGKTKAHVYKNNVGEPEESLRFSNGIRNQYETPVLFYAVCLAAYVTQNATGLMIFLAFAFALLKLAHLLVHITTNKIRHRFRLFGLSLLILLVMWLLLAFNLLS